MPEKRRGGRPRKKRKDPAKFGLNQPEYKNRKFRGNPKKLKNPEKTGLVFWQDLNGKKSGDHMSLVPRPVPSHHTRQTCSPQKKEGKGGIEL